MSKQTELSARFVAMKTLNQLDLQKNYASEILNRHLPQTTRTQKATDLVFGTIRNLHAIDTIITKVTRRPLKAISKKLLTIIRIAAYELIYCPKTASYAIVNEAVENTKKFAGKKQAGFVNASIRQITRAIKERSCPIENNQITKILPTSTDTGCLFNIDILPHPRRRPDQYLSQAFSLPLWLTKDWINNFGYKQAHQICIASNTTPSICLRINPLQTTMENYTQLLKDAEIKYEPIDDQYLRLTSPKAISDLPGFDQGLFSIQDTAASLPAKQMAPKPSQKILDLCSAPGGKTTQLAEISLDNAQIFATDINSNRLEKVKTNAERLLLNSIKTIPFQQIEKYKPFDAILTDVPCSNTAVLAKRPEARHRLIRKTADNLAKTQRQILQNALTMVEKDGFICYSTCSIDPRENSLLVKDFINHNPRVKLIKENTTLPSATPLQSDGGYYAIIKC